MKRVSLALLWIAWAGAVLLGLPASGLDLGDTVQVHGFGGWGYGKTDSHSYSIGTPEGNYQNAEFTLNLTAQPAESLSIVAQVHFDAGAQETTELDYAFAEWSFSDLARLRIGRVKHPFGIYGEIPDVGTLRPFLFLPQSIYGPLAYTAKYYDGVGLTGDWFLPGDRWRLQYDIYGGQIQGDFNTISSELESSIGLFTVSDTIGLRLRAVTPVPGLSFSLSAYQGNEVVVNSMGANYVDRQTELLSAEYLGSALWIRAEAGRLESGPYHVQNSAYMETAYKITDHWQIAARYDWAEIDLQGGTAGLPPVFNQLFDHEEPGLGLNYWFSPQLVVRLGYHRVQGNLLTTATPEDLFNALLTGELAKETRLFTFGAQFSF